MSHPAKTIPPAALPLVTLVREETGPQGTIGTMSFPGGTVRTLELPWRSNARKLSCIPLGRYTCTVVPSSRFGMVYHVNDVKSRTGILIHAANFAGDVKAGYHSELEGCIAPCRRIGTLNNPAHKMQMAGLVSRPALEFFMESLQRRDFVLELTGVCG